MAKTKDKSDVMETTLSSFASLQSSLLGLEREAELSSSLLAGDTRLQRVRAVEVRSAVLGKISIKVAKDASQKLALPPHNISIGDVVQLESSDEGLALGLGIVSRLTQTSMLIVVEGREVEDCDKITNQAVKVVKMANDVTHRRLMKALRRLEQENKDHVLVGLLFSDGKTSSLGVPHQSLPPTILDHEGEIAFRNKTLNGSQKEAIEFALKQRELAIIHGPPGTGKTTTLVELVSLAVQCGLKVLCCAPSNVAVDNFLEKLVDCNSKIKVVRLGHPVRINETLRKHALEALIADHEQTLLAKDIRREISDQLSLLSSLSHRSKRQNIKSELRLLRKELIDREKRSMKEILKSAEVVMATLTSSSVDDSPLKHIANQFDLVVVDECSQSIELACWIALTQAKKAVLAGDHRQLPPTVISEEAARQGLSLSLMERLLNTFEHSNVVRMLSTQYRMNSLIMGWSNERFYDGLLKAEESVSKRLLCDIKGITKNDVTESPLVLIDTSHCDMHELSSPDGSRANPSEAALVLMYLHKLLKSGLKPTDIAVITPYNLQVALIRAQLSAYPELEVRSVDGFQGREKECIVISLVRSNPMGEVGFLDDERRLNVAITRAKRQVAIVGDMSTVGRDKHLKGFVNFLEEKSDTRSANQYREEIENMELVWPEGMQNAVYNDGYEANKGVQDMEIEEKKKKTKVKNKQTKNMQKTDSEEVQNKVTINDKSTKKEAQKLEEPDDEEESVRKKRQYKEQLETFMKNSSEPSLAFGASLSSYDRMLIHELAEQLALKHESRGEGKMRQLIVSKKIAEKDKDKLETKGEDKEKKECFKCNVDVPASNLELHVLRCPAAKKSEDTDKTQSDVKSRIKQKSKKKEKPSANAHNTKTKSKKSERSDLPDDVDDLLDHFKSLNNVCNLANCREKVQIMGLNCDLCRARFCLKHGMPEVHGCGEQARRVARNSFLGGGTSTTSASGRIRHAQLQNRLGSKIKEMEQDRRVKNKKK